MNTIELTTYVFDKEYEPLTKQTVELNDHVSLKGLTQYYQVQHLGHKVVFDAKAGLPVQGNSLLLSV